MYVSKIMQNFIVIKVTTSTSLTLVHEGIMMVISLKAGPWITFAVLPMRATYMFATYETGGT